MVQPTQPALEVPMLFRESEELELELWSGDTESELEQ